MGEGELLLNWSITTYDRNHVTVIQFQFWDIRWVVHGRHNVNLPLHVDGKRRRKREKREKRRGEDVYNSSICHKFRKFPSFPPRAAQT